MFSEHFGSRRSSGNEFQTVGPATENAVNAEPMTWHRKLVTAGRTQTLSEDDVRDWRAVVHQVPVSYTHLTLPTKRIV